MNKYLDEPLKSRLKKNSITNIIYFCVLIPINFIVTPLILRHVGKEIFGVWTLTWTILAFMEFLSLQTPSAVAVFVPKHDPEKEADKINEIMNTLFIFYLAMALVCALLFMFCESWLIKLFFKVGPGLMPDTRFVLGFSFYLFIINFILACFCFLLSGFNIYYVYNIMHIIISVIRFVLFVAVLRAGLGIRGVTVVQMLSIVTETIIILIITKIMFPPLKFNPKLFSLKKLKEMLSLSVKMLVTRIAGTVNYNVDKLVLGYFLNPVIAGYYQIGANISKYISTIPDMLGLPSLLPAASELKAKDQMHKLEILYERANKYMFYAAMLLLSGIVFFGKDFVDLWLGPGFESVYLAMVFLAAAYTISLFGYSAINLLNGLEKVNEPMVVSLIGAVLNIVLSIILTKKFGLEGALAGTTVSMCLTAIALYVLFYKILKYRLNFMHIFFKPIISLIIARGIFIFLNKAFIFGKSWLLLFAGIAAFCAVFIVLTVFIFRHFDDYDMDLIKGMFSAEGKGRQ